MNHYIQELLRGVTAQICQTIGYNGTQATPLELLHDALHKFLLEFSRDLRRQVEHYNRTEANLSDCMLTLNNLNINISELFDYVNNVQPVLPSNEVAKFPVPKESNLNFLKPGSKEVLIRPMHIYEHLPPILPAEPNETTNSSDGVVAISSAKSNGNPNAADCQMTEKDEDSMKTATTITKNNSPSLQSAALPSGTTGSTANIFPKASSSSASAASSAALPLRFDEEGRPTREIQSVVMTIGGYISPAIEGKLPDVLIPDIIEKLQGLDAPPPSPTVTVIAGAQALRPVAASSIPDNAALLEADADNVAENLSAEQKSASATGALIAEPWQLNTKPSKTAKQMSSMNAPAASSSVVSKLLKLAKKKMPGSANIAMPGNLSYKYHKRNALRKKMDAASTAASNRILPINEKAQRKLLKIYQKLSKTPETPSSKTTHLANHNVLLGSPSELLSGTAAKSGGGRGSSSTTATAKQMKKQTKHCQKKLRQLKELLELNTQNAATGPEAAAPLAAQAKLFDAIDISGVEKRSFAAAQNAQKQQQYLTNAGAVAGTTSDLQTENASVGVCRSSSGDAGGNGEYSKLNANYDSNLEIKLSNEPDRSKLNIFKKISKQKGNRAATHSPIGNTQMGGGGGECGSLYGGALVNADSSSHQLINLPSGTTITPAPPQTADSAAAAAAFASGGGRALPMDLSADDVVKQQQLLTLCGQTAALKNKPKKRGRKPGSKNQPKPANVGTDAPSFAGGQFAAAGNIMSFPTTAVHKKIKKPKGDKSAAAVGSSSIGGTIVSPVGKAGGLLQPTNLIVGMKGAHDTSQLPYGVNHMDGKQPGFDASLGSDFNSAGGGRTGDASGRKMKNVTAAGQLDRYAGKSGGGTVDESNACAATTPSKEEVNTINRKLMRMDTTLKPLALPSHADHMEMTMTTTPSAAMVKSPGGGGSKKRPAKQQQFGKTGNLLPPLMTTAGSASAPAGPAVGLANLPAQMLSMFYSFQPRPGLIPQPGLFSGQTPVGMVLNSLLPFPPSPPQSTSSLNAAAKAAAAATSADSADNSTERNYCNVAPLVPASMKLTSIAKMAVGGGSSRKQQPDVAKTHKQQLAGVAAGSIDTLQQQQQDVVKPVAALLRTDEPIEVSDDSLDATMPATIQAASKASALPASAQQLSGAMNSYFANVLTTLNTGGDNGGAAHKLKDGGLLGADKSLVKKSKKSIFKAAKRTPASGLGATEGLPLIANGGGSTVGVGKLAGGADLIPLNTSNNGAAATTVAATAAAAAMGKGAHIYLGPSTAVSTAGTPLALTGAPPTAAAAATIPTNLFPDLSIKPVNVTTTAAASANFFDAVSDAAAAAVVSTQQQQQQQAQALQKLKHHKEHKKWKKVTKDGRIKKKKDKKDKMKNKERYSNDKYLLQQQLSQQQQQKPSGSKALSKEQRVYAKYELSGSSGASGQRHQDKELLRKLKKERKREKEKHRQLSGGALSAATSAAVTQQQLPSTSAAAAAGYAHGKATTTANPAAAMQPLASGTAELLLSGSGAGGTTRATPAGGEMVMADGVVGAVGPPTPPLPKLTLRFSGSAHSRSNSPTPLLIAQQQQQQLATADAVATAAAKAYFPSVEQQQAGGALTPSHFVGGSAAAAQRRHNSRDHQREPSPELAKISPLVTRPPKQKLIASAFDSVMLHAAATGSPASGDIASSAATVAVDTVKHSVNSSTASTISANASGSVSSGGGVVHKQKQQSVGILPPPNPWLSGGTLTASSVLLPQQLLQASVTSGTAAPATTSHHQLANNIAAGGVKSKSHEQYDEDIQQQPQQQQLQYIAGNGGGSDKLSGAAQMTTTDGGTTTAAGAASTSAVANAAAKVRETTLVPEANRPSSYIDAEGNRVWICPACGKVDDGSPMIGCDGCDAWYHWVCVGIFVAPKDNEDWFCRVCIMRKKGVHVNKKPKRSKKK